MTQQVYRTPAEERGYTDEEGARALAYWWGLSDEKQVDLFGGAQGRRRAFNDKQITWGKISGASLVKELLAHKERDELARIIEEVIVSPTSSSPQRYLPPCQDFH